MKKPFGYVDHRAIHQPDNPADKCFGDLPCSADNLNDRLRHVAEDHLYCKDTLIAAADAIERMAEALDELSQPLGRSDYTVGQLDNVVRKIATDALTFERNAGLIHS
jgi:hypothetical protein